MTEKSKLLERLQDVHSFPGEYVFKVIGENSEEFVSRVVQAAINVLGASAAPNVSTRESSGGKHLSVTLTVDIAEAEEVLEIYEVMQEMDGVKFLL